jgi:hypothetical protein
VAARQHPGDGGKLEGFVDPDKGTIHEIEARLARANEIEARTIDDYASDWEDAIEDIKKSPKYGGLEIQPQIGLVPLGPDPESQLWEFWVWESGERPGRDEKTGRWKITGESAVVLVLLPAGTFWMGVGRTPSDPHWDPDATTKEMPAHQVTLGAFLLSKYELTQGQWARIVPDNPSPSYYNAASNLVIGEAAAHPVEYVNWHDVDSAAHRIGLKLPTEAQWEYAARAGTTRDGGPETIPRSWQWQRISWTAALSRAGCDTMAEFRHVLGPILFGSMRQWVSSLRVHSAFMTCWAMCGSGALTACTRTTSSQHRAMDSAVLPSWMLRVAAGRFQRLRERARVRPSSDRAGHP